MSARGTGLVRRVGVRGERLPGRARRQDQDL